jgi:DHA1 family multidrug resistance protein-like MFS transporter
MLGLCTLAAAVRWLPESLSTQVPRSKSEEPDPDWRTLGRSLGPLLGLALVAQFALAMFEATFALHAQAILELRPGGSGSGLHCAGS